jgi:acetyl esterase/lipase
MTFSTRDWAALCLISCALIAVGPAAAADSSAGAKQEVVKIWPGKPPGTEDWTKAESVEQTMVPDAGRAVQLVKNVSEPTLTVFRPDQPTGAAMIVLPGGGWGALAWDLEGTEIAQWLTERGITAFVLKYRVQDGDAALMSKMVELMGKPATPGRFDEFMKLLEPKRRIAIDDAMQAMRVIRSGAQEYGVAADRIGMMGFSAGAMTTVSVALEGDAATRPNFVAPIYGANASDKAPTKDAPPLFMAVAADDKLTSAGENIKMFEAWQSAGVPAELHIYQNGGHGFGHGKPGTATAKWMDAFEAWLSLRGLTSVKSQ